MEIFWCLLLFAGFISDAVARETLRFAPMTQQSRIFAQTPFLNDRLPATQITAVSDAEAPSSSNSIIDNSKPDKRNFDGQKLNLGEAAWIASLKSPHSQRPKPKRKTKQIMVTVKLIRALQRLPVRDIIRFVSSQTGGKVQLTPEKAQQFKRLPAKQLVRLINSGSLTRSGASLGDARGNNVPNQGHRSSIDDRQASGGVLVPEFMGKSPETFHIMPSLSERLPWKPTPYLQNGISHVRRSIFYPQAQFRTNGFGAMFPQRGRTPPVYSKPISALPVAPTSAIFTKIPRVVPLRTIKPAKLRPFPTASSSVSKTPPITVEQVLSLQQLPDRDVVSVVKQRTGRSLTPDEVRIFKSLPATVITDLVNRGTLA